MNWNLISFANSEVLDFLQNVLLLSAHQSYWATTSMIWRETMRLAELDRKSYFFPNWAQKVPVNDQYRKTEPLHACKLFR